MSEPVLIARCPEHGLHGERQECFVCGGPVEQVPMVALSEHDALLLSLKGEGEDFGADRAQSREKLRGSIERIITRQLFLFEDDFAPDAHQRNAAYLADALLVVLDAALDSQREAMRDA